MSVEMQIYRGVKPLLLVLMLGACRPAMQGSPLELALADPRTERELRAGQAEEVGYVIRNNTPVHVEGLMIPGLPAGFTSEPARASFAVPAGETTGVQFVVYPTQALEPGRYRLKTTCRVGTLTAKTPEITLIQPGPAARAAPEQTGANR